MRLEFGTFHVNRAEFSNETKWEHGRLFVDREAARQVCLQEPALSEVSIALVHPGESARIVHCLDIVEPRIKVQGDGCAFPGFLGATDTIGDGRTHRLRVNLIQTAQYPEPQGGLLSQREGIIEMSGPGSNYCVGSDTVNIVLHFEAAPGVSNAEFDTAMRMATLRLSALLAETIRDQEPDEETVYEQTRVSSDLPRVAYVYQLQSQGLLADTFLYGVNARGLVPTLIHPNEVFDGAIVSGNYIFNGMKVPTTVHCNNPVIRDLYRRHGRELNFVGVVLTEGHSKTLEGKQRLSNFGSKLVRLLGAQGAILTQESGGMSIVDQMLMCQSLERHGIKTTLISYEMGGPEGTDPALIYNLPEADAIVSTGNREERITLPQVDRVLGGDYLVDSDIASVGPLTVSLVSMYSSINQVGMLKLRAYGY